MFVAAPPALPAVHGSPALVSAHTAVVATRPGPRAWTTYVVRPGDTLFALAASHRCTVGEIAARNGIGDPRTLRAGARIQVPVSTGSTTARAGRTGSMGSYTVRAGDTLYGIATRHGMSLPALVKANGLSVHEFIHPGQVLRVGSAATPTKATTTKATTTRARQQQAASRGTGRRAASPRTVFPGHSSTPHPTASVSRNRTILAAAIVPDRMTTKAMIISTARSRGVDPKLALAIAMRESSWDHRSVSGANAIGVMQVLPSSGTWAETLLGRQLNLFDAQDNITAGVVMLRALVRMAGSEDEAIAAYYQGLGSVRARGWYTDTRAYVTSVKALRARM